MTKAQKMALRAVKPQFLRDKALKADRIHKNFKSQVTKALKMATHEPHKDLKSQVAKARKTATHEPHKDLKS